MNQKTRYVSRSNTGEGKPPVNATELHAFLESKQEFAYWIKGRINQYGFVEGVDFIAFDQIFKRDTGGTTKKEYDLSIPMAKEMSMVERTEKVSWPAPIPVSPWAPSIGVSLRDDCFSVSVTGCIFIGFICFNPYPRYTYFFTEGRPILVLPFYATHIHAH